MSLQNVEWHCRVEGCANRKGIRKDLCEMHYQRMHRHGSFDKPIKKMPTRENHYKWTGDDLSYSSAHKRIAGLKGRASQCMCPCGKPARHWAYDHLDPNEKRSKEGPYSSNPEHYFPKCVSCHRIEDNAWLRQARTAA